MEVPTARSTAADDMAADALGCTAAVSAPALADSSKDCRQDPTRPKATTMVAKRNKTGVITTNSTVRLPRSLRVDKAFTRIP